MWFTAQNLPLKAQIPPEEQGASFMSGGMTATPYALEKYLSDFTGRHTPEGKFQKVKKITISLSYL